MSEHQDLPGEAWPNRGSGGRGVPSLDGAHRRPKRGAPSAKVRAALPLATVGAGMSQRWLTVRPDEVVFVKGIIEASEGLAGMFAERGGELLLATPVEREAELVELLADLAADLGAADAAPARGEV